MNGAREMPARMPACLLHSRGLVRCRPLRESRLCKARISNVTYLKVLIDANADPEIEVLLYYVDEIAV